MPADPNRRGCLVPGICVHAWLLTAANQHDDQNISLFFVRVHQFNRCYLNFNPLDLGTRSYYALDPRFEGEK